MKKIIVTLVILIFFDSCSSSLDCGKSISTDCMDFNYLDNLNEFVYKSKVNATADKEIYYTTNFSINLPKKIKNWQISSNEFYFEYAGKEIIYINSGYKNKGSAGNWVIRDTEYSEMYSFLRSYWNKRNYDEDDLRLKNSDRISKVYSDGKIIIFLYNIKQDHFEKYLTLIKSFKYLN